MKLWKNNKKNIWHGINNRYWTPQWGAEMNSDCKYMQPLDHVWVFSLPADLDTSSNPSAVFCGRNVMRSFYRTNQHAEPKPHFQSDRPVTPLYEVLYASCVTVSFFFWTMTKTTSHRRCLEVCKQACLWNLTHHTLPSVYFRSPKRSRHCLNDFTVA